MIKKKFEKDGFTFYEYLGNNITDRGTNIYTGVPLSEIKKIKTKIEIIEYNNFGENGYIFITSKASPTAEVSRMYVGLKHDKSAGIGIGSTVYNNNIATTTLDVSSSNIAVIGGWVDTIWTTYYRYKEIVFYDNNNKIIRDFVPASNGREYGLYDLSNDVFYSNQGNGSFVVSEDFACVVRAVSRICKGLKNIAKVKKVVDVTDQMTDSVGNYYWNAENQEWTGAGKEYCHVGNVVGIIDKYGLQKYVIEFDARTDVEGRVSVYDTSGNKYKYTFIKEQITCKKEWQHYKFTGKAKLGVDGGHECNISFYSEYGTGVIPHIKNLKIRTAVDVFTHVTSEVVEGVVEVGPAKVSDGVLEIKGDNVKVKNNKLIIK